MAANINRPAAGLAIGTSATNLYTVPASKVWVCKRLTITNTTATPQTVTIGTSGGAGFNIVTALAVAANSSIRVDAIEGHVFNAAEVIQATASAGSSLTVARFSGLLSDP